MVRIWKRITPATNKLIKKMKWFDWKMRCLNIRLAFRHCNGPKCSVESIGYLPSEDVVVMM